MELRTLRYFLEVAREENMTEAANVLHVTQPTLSRQIADLEQELGCTLFIRTNRSTTLTENGMRLRQRAEEILALVEQTEDEVGAGTELTGNIRIGAGESFAMQAVTDAFAALHAAHPRITCEFSTGNADAIEERLERGLVDFAVVLEPFNVEKYENLKLPAPERVGLIMRRDHPLATHPAIVPEDLKGMDLLASSRTAHQTYDLISWADGALAADDIHIVGRFDMIGNAERLVRSGVACAVAIEGVTAPDLIFIPFEPAIGSGAYLIWKKFRLLTKTSEAFLEEMRSSIEKGSRAGS